MDVLRQYDPANGLIFWTLPLPVSQKGASLHKKLYSELNQTTFFFVSFKKEKQDY